MSSATLSIRPLEVVDARDIPTLTGTEFQESILEKTRAGERILSLFTFPAEEAGVPKLLAVLADGANGTISIFSTAGEDLKGDGYAEFLSHCPQAHPFLPQAKIFPVEGEEVHEVAVGPVHAGIIEPGHFRFQCHGEDVLSLDISLGYQHRGIEKYLAGGPNKKTLHYMETLAGDSTIAHATAYAQALEALSSCEIPARADALRAVALELERLANHAGDLGALAADVGFLPTSAYCGRLRGEFLNLTAEICGNRFGRGLVRPGGVHFDLDEAQCGQHLKTLERVMKDLRQAAELLWSTPSVLSRFEGIGRLSLDTVEQLGMVGLAARACGLERDARLEFPSGYYRFTHIPVSTWHTGDVFSRAYLRWLEIERSYEFVREQLSQLPKSARQVQAGPPAPSRLVISLVEGWRGEVCHTALTDENGRFSVYKVVDPSAHNWKGLAMAMRGGQISDFPLINKSFNLSYAGNDL